MLTPPSSAADRPGNSAEDGASLAYSAGYDVSDFVRAVDSRCCAMVMLYNWM